MWGRGVCGDSLGETERPGAGQTILRRPLDNPDRGTA